MDQPLDHVKMKALRLARKLTQQVAADRAGCTLSRWNDVESGRRSNVTLETLNAIAAALQCDARELIAPPEAVPPKRAKEITLGVFAMKPKRPRGT